MKKQVTGMLILVFLLISTTGCIQVEMAAKEAGNYFFTGESEHWHAIYTVSDIKGNYYDSIYLQYTGDGKVSDATYHLKGKFVTASNRITLDGEKNSYQDSSRWQEKVKSFEPSHKEKLELTMKWNGEEENIVLSLEQD
ncbi:hypothetical protein [Pseudalkalibacillus caeni]|uniref:Lipoprotein n=1 Tax=Exobacillus caeni TaxID=2574798 RepID=A0A5R9FBC6_9BACL|nr:hypothetical protein [Pseudalkalibacillus caeni]TLS38193.1 hypothetical protein FCL54_06555 [Pseudalkalibacillus caeni]